VDDGWSLTAKEPPEPVHTGESPASLHTGDAQGCNAELLGALGQPNDARTWVIHQRRIPAGAIERDHEVEGGFLGASVHVAVDVVKHPPAHGSRPPEPRTTSAKARTCRSW